MKMNTSYFKSVILAWLFALRKRGHMKYVAKMKLYVVTW